MPVLWLRHGAGPRWFLRLSRVRWEDDGQDDHDADEVRGGPNSSLSLTQARANYRRIDAGHERDLSHVRPPTAAEYPPSH
jgi:hypothetical protein